MGFFQPPMRFWTITTIIALVLGFALFSWIWSFADEALREDVLKILLQFLMVTVAGGVFLIAMNARRDEDRKDDAREAAVREMVDQIWAAYRKLEMVKRRLRSQMAVPERGPNRPRNLPYKIPAKAFETAMDDLLAAQIESEQVRDRVTSRQDLLNEDRISRLRMALDYAAGYFADVYEDVEDCVVTRTDDYYEVTADCRGLSDFLGRRRWKDPPETPWSDDVQGQYAELIRPEATLRDRYAALGRIETLRGGEGLRFRLIATQCIALAATDIHLALRRRRWLSPFADGEGWLD